MNQIDKMYTNIYSLMFLHKKSVSLPNYKNILLQRGILKVKQVDFFSLVKSHERNWIRYLAVVILPNLRIYFDNKFMTSMNLKCTLRVRRQRFTFKLIHMKILGHFVLETILRCHNFAELGNSCWQNFDDFDDLKMDFGNETDRDLHAQEVMWMIPGHFVQEAYHLAPIRINLKPSALSIYPNNRWQYVSWLDWTCFVYRNAKGIYVYSCLNYGHHSHQTVLDNPRMITLKGK